MRIQNASVKGGAGVPHIIQPPMSAPYFGLFDMSTQEELQCMNLMTSSLSSAHHNIDACSRIHREREAEASLRSDRLREVKQQHTDGVSRWMCVQEGERNLQAAADAFRLDGAPLLGRSLLADKELEDARFKAMAAKVALNENVAKCLRADSMYTMRKLQNSVTDYSTHNAVLCAKLEELTQADAQEQERDQEAARRCDSANSRLGTMHMTLLESSATMITASALHAGTQAPSGIRADMFSDDDTM